MLAAKHFADILPPQSVLTDPQELMRYGKDWLKDFKPNPAVILLPDNYTQVQAIVRRCSDAKISLVPSGGRTGLSGGATAMNGEAVIALDRLNKIINVCEVDRTLTCEAGVITQKVQDEAQQHGLYFPVDFASKGSSQIGGNIATNAGGIRVIRYGNIRESVVGLKVVTGTGELLALNGSLFKNQSGYDFRSLFIGSEGTLGIVVETTLKLTGQPGELIRSFCGLRSLDQVLPLLAKVRAHSRDVSAFEFFTRNALEKVVSHQRLPDPLSERFPYYVVIEFERGSAATRENLEQFFFNLMEDGAVAEAVLSASERQAQEIMALRERIAETLSALHIIHKNDISVPVPAIAEFVKELQQRIMKEYPNFEAVIFGHIGDGNLHINILKPEGMTSEEFYKRCHTADHSLFDVVRAYQGSISAEHGVGLLKKDFLRYTRSAHEIELMRKIKAVFDPHGILNPGKIFDQV